MKEKKTQYKKYFVNPRSTVPRTTLHRLRNDISDIPSAQSVKDDVAAFSSEYKNQKRIDVNSSISIMKDSAAAMDVEEFDLCNPFYRRLDRSYLPDHENSNNAVMQLTSSHFLVEDINNPEEHLIAEHVPDEVNIAELEEMEELEKATDPFIDILVKDSRHNAEDNTPFKKLFKLINSDEFSNNITETVDKTKGEILMILLKYAITHCLSQTAVTDLFMVINSLFSFPILPDSRFLIDCLFNPKNNAIFHGICPECGLYIGIFERSSKVIKCNNCSTDIDVKSSSYNDYFVFFNFKSQISELVEANSDYYCYVMNQRIHDKNVLKDIYDGEMYQAFINSLCVNERNKYLTTTFNTDGAPLYSSSSYSIWPIFLQINELPFNIRTSELIVCGLWFGKNKPDMNVFLYPFVQSMNELSKEGVQCKINGKEECIKVYALVSCVDSVARAPMQGMNQFNGHYGCNWCLHPGKWVTNPLNPNSGAYKYPLCNTPISKRNVHDSINHIETGTPTKPCFGFKTASELINLEKFNFIEGQVPDYLHILSGIGKTFASIWFGSKKQSSSMVPKEEIEKINILMEKIKVPCQIGRLARSLKDKEFWKAREWENWILYYSLPIMSLVLEKKYVLHWLLLVEAVYILLQDKITLEELDNADKLVHTFVADTEKLYSAIAMTYNVHLLLHLAKSVLNWGPLFAHSAYGFEAGNGKLIKIIHASKGVHYQVARHIGLTFSHLAIKDSVYTRSSVQMRNYYDRLGSTKAKNTLKLSEQRYFGASTKVDDAWINTLSLSNKPVSFFKMIKNGCLYLSSEKVNKRSDNTVVLLADGSYGSIIQFIVDGEKNEEYVLLKLLRTKNAFFNSKHKIFQQVIKVDSQITAKAITEICKITVSFDIGNDWFVCAVPNLLSY